MPPLTIPRSAPIGDIRSLTRSTEISPRAEYPTGAPVGGDKTTQIEAQSALTEAQIGSEMSDTGTQLAQLAETLRKPYEQLRQSREVMQATDIANRAVLDARDGVQALKSSNQPYTTWAPLAEQQIDMIFLDANRMAQKISPAAQEVVNRELLQERLSLLTDVHHTVLAKDIDYQKGVYQTTKDLALQNYFSTEDPAKRAAEQGRLFGRLELLRRTHVITEQEYVHERDDWNNRVDKNDIIAIGIRDGLEAAQLYANGNTRLSPVQRAEYLAAAQSAVHFNLTEKNKAEHRALMTIKANQETLGAEIYRQAIDPSNSIPKLEDLKSHVRTMSATLVSDLYPENALTGAQAEKAYTAIEHNIAQQKNPHEHGNPQRTAAVAMGLHQAPNAYSWEDIMALGDLSGAEKLKLFDLKQTMLDKKSVAHSPVLKSYLDIIEHVVPESTKNMLMNSPNAKAALLSTEAEGKSELLVAMLEAEKKSGGYLSPDQIRQLAEPMLQRIKERIQALPLSILGSDYNTAPKVK